MLITSWLQSFQNLLKSRPRKVVRHIRRRTPDHRRGPSQRAEDLEIRSLLTSPELIAISPNVGEFIDSGDVLNDRPQQLTFQFSPGQTLDFLTLDAIQIVGSGFDDTFGDGNEIPIAAGFRGLGDTPDQVVFRFASPLQDDRYQITINGTTNPLTNTDGDVFNDGVDETIEFDLNLGATIQAIVPQPVVRSQELTIGNVAQLQDGDTVTINDGAQSFVFEFEDTANGPAGITGDVAVVFDSANDDSTAVATALENAINGTTFLGEGVTVVRAAATVTITGNSLDATVAPTTTNAGVVAVAAGGIEQHRDQVIVYFNPDTLDQASAETRSFYQLINTADTLDQSDDSTANPTTVRYDSEQNLAVLTFASADIDPAGGATFRLRIGTDAAETSFSTVATPGTDDNSSFATASGLGTLTATGIEFSAAIEPQSIALPVYPGGSDEPGHRDIPAEDHGAGSGVFSTAPNDIGVIGFYFPQVYGQLQGNDQLNEITANQRDRTREIFEIFSGLYGFESFELATQPGVNPGDPDRPVIPAGRSFNQVLSIVTGNVTVAAPTFPPTGVSVGGGGGIIIDGSQNFGSSPFGGSWFDVATHEIGHSIGLGHSYDIPSEQGNGTLGEDQYPGNHDIVHGRRLHRPDATDIDLYSFNLSEAGTVSAEIVAERLVNATGGDDPSLLNSVLRLYRQDPLDPTRRILVAQNDDYFSNDSFLELELEAGDYFIGVSSTGNADYDPTISDTGFGGLTDGDYDLRVLFTPAVTAGIVDTDGTAFDGDADGAPGGVFDFHFRSDTTIFVDKANDTAPGDEGDGSLADPYDTIDAALAAAVPGNIVRIVGNGGADNDISTSGDNRPYLVGTNDGGVPLIDGDALNVTQDVVLQVDAGVTIKLQSANIDAGTSSLGNLRSGAAVQILGTPQTDVILTAYGNDAIGGDSDGVTDGANPGDWGGVVFREDSDFQAADAATQPGSPGIFLNYVNYADITFGGGQVPVDGDDRVYTPIHLVSARPTISNNRIFDGATAAMSANPDSFDDSRGRIGPDIHGNLLGNNSTNGLLFRIDTEFGQPIDRLSVPARLDDADIVHVITQNLEIVGNAGGPEGNVDGTIDARLSGRLAVDPGVVLKIGSSRIESLRGNAHFIAEGTAEQPVVITSILDDRYGAGGTFDTTGNGTDINGATDTDGDGIIDTGDGVDDITGFDYNAAGVALPELPQPGDWAGLVFNAGSRGSIDQAIISFAGGGSPIASFNTIEVLHRADLRLANSILENNADGIVSGTDATRDNRGTHSSALIFVRQAQPVILNNTFRNNGGSVIHINANALTSEFVADPGRTTGAISNFPQYADNQGPLVRLNRMENNDLNGMEVRGDTLTTESIWDDTDIVHVLRSEIIVNHHHTYSGLRLESSPTESLVVKLDGGNAGFTASGIPLDIDDRIGGTVQVVGQPLFPVVLTSLFDDSIGASRRPDGFPQTDTDNGATDPVAGDWRGLLFDQFANDRNVRVINERESANNSGVERNGTTNQARLIGNLAPDYKSGDENRSLGFDIHGFISADDSGDVDVYSFEAIGGTEVWFDLDSTAGSLSAVLELVELGAEFNTNRVNARAAYNDGTGTLDITSPSGNLTGTNLGPLMENVHDGGDFYSTNHRDPGFRAVLPGTPGAPRTYFVRVRSNQANPADLNDLNQLGDGLTSGEYQLQVRLQQVDEKSGATVRNADIRYASTGIHVQGLPFHSPLLSETAETGDAPGGGGSLQIGNLLEVDRNTISVGGNLDDAGDIDNYGFNVDYATTTFGPSIQSIGGVNDGGKTWSTVFDIDYADGLTRGNTTLIVYDGDGNPILIGRDSNIDADQPTGLPGDGNSSDDLTRGSAGVLDPFIGPVQLPAGNPGDTTPYTVSVHSDGRLQNQFDQFYFANATNDAIRLEPVNSIERIIEDHIGFEGYTSNEPFVLPRNENADNPTGLLFPNLTDETVLSTNQTYDSPATGTPLPTNVRPFDLSDVPLFVSGVDAFVAVNPFQGGIVNNIDNNFDQSANNRQTVRDIVMRSDGRLYGYRDLRGATANTGTANTVGELVTIDPATGVVTAVGTDNILGRGTTVAVNNAITLDELTIGDNVGAVTFDRDSSPGNAADYVAYYAVHENTGNPANNFPNSKLYRANAGTGAVQQVGNNQGFGDIQYIDVDYAEQAIRIRNNAGTPQFATITLQSRAPGAVGNAYNLVVNHGTNTTLDVSVTGNTITVRIDDGNNASQIAAAINSDVDANRLVTALVSQNDGGVTANANLTVDGPFTGGDDGAIGPLRGNVTGLSFGGFYGSNGPTATERALYGITDAGEFISINTSNGTATLVYDLAADGTLGGLDTEFVGLSLGPQNVAEFDAAGIADPGRYANLLFALAQDGTLIALDPAIAPAGGVGTGGALQTIFDSTGLGVPDTDRIQTNANGATGLAFSPLDFNLWHPTTTRSSDEGHGINTTFDNTRTPTGADRDLMDGLTDGVGNENYGQTEAEGGTSFYFGLDNYRDNDTNDYYNYTSDRGQLGLLNHDVQRDLTSNPVIGENYNLPGGALGSLVTAPFDLVSQFGNGEAADRPVLYFNYFLGTEDQAGGTARDDEGDARDAARVFITDDGGATWQLIATNNGDGTPSGGNVRDESSELPTFASANRNADLGDPRQATQELFDNTGAWRQARIDLSDYVGQTDVMLRFDFSTSGSMNDDSLRTGLPLGTGPMPNINAFTDNFGNFFTEFGDAQPSLDNDHEGFYIDDLILGWAERGEIVTAADTTAGYFSTPTDPDPTATTPILSGNYQLEIRRGYEFAGPASATDPELVITDAAIPDTNAQFVPGGDLGLGAGLTLDFESPGDFNQVTISQDDGGRRQFIPTTLDGTEAIGTHAPGALGTIKPNSQGEVIIVVTTGQGLLEFDRFFEPEVGHDTFEVFIDGTAITAADFSTNATDTATVTTTIPISAGVHTVRFIHKKGPGGTEGLGQLTIDNIMFPAIGGDLRGDRNLRREQGLFLISNNIILDSEVYGINVEEADRQPGTLTPYPGAPIRFETLNNQRLAPGAVIQNNIISRSNNAGIRFAGDASAGGPPAAVPVGKIINNTIVGATTTGNQTSGVGIEIGPNTQPTILNNIISRTATAITVAGSSSAVVERTHFYRNASNGAVGQNAINVALNAASPPPLFVAASRDNYYLRLGSLAIDRSQGSVPESSTFTSVKDDLGIPQSDAFSPTRDLFGQLRRDDPASPGPGSGGESFNDIGAVERADFIGPFATLEVPLDNGTDDLDPSSHNVIRIVDNFLPRFVVKLNDDGIGVDDAFIFSSQWAVTQNGQLLVEGVDYTFIYNPATDEVIFQAVTSFETDSEYTITLIDRSTASGVRDLAGNPIQSNRPNGDVRFHIVLDNGVNDPPETTVPDGVTLSEDSDPTDLVFGAASGQVITTSDPDAGLGNNELTIAIFAEQGTLLLPGAVTTSVAGDSLVFPDAETLLGDRFRIVNGTDPDNVLIQEFTFVDAATNPSPAATEVAINSNDLATDVATAAAAAINAFYGTPVGTVTADTVNLAAPFTASRLLVSGSAIDVTGSSRMTLFADSTGLGGAFVIGERFTVGIVTFEYVDRAIFDSSTAALTPALNQIAVADTDTAAEVADLTRDAINQDRFFGAGTATSTGDSVDLTDPALYFSNTDGTSIQVNGLSVTLPNASTAIEEEVEIVGPDATIYRFVDIAAGTPAANEIPVNSSASPNAVAAAFLQRLIADQGAGSARRSGNTVTLDTGTGNSPQTVRPQILSGGTLTVPDGPTVVGDHIAVGRTVFTYVDAAIVATPSASEIPIDLSNPGVSDTPAAVAAATETVLDTFFGNAVTATASGDQVTLTGVIVSGVTPATGQRVLTLVGDINLLNQALDGLEFVPDAEYFGPAAITILTEDLGQYTHDPALRINRSDLDVIPITIVPVNDDPTIDPIADVDITEDQDLAPADGTIDEQVVALSGITAGPINELEDISVTASLATTTNVAVANGARVIGQTLTADGVGYTYVDAATTTPTATQIGVLQTDSTDVVATQTAMVINADRGDTVARTSTPSAFGFVSFALDIADVSGPASVFDIRDQDALIAAVDVDYTTADETGQLRFTPVVDAFGIVDVVVRVRDYGLNNVLGDADDAFIDEIFTVTILPNNDDPTLDPITSVVIDEDPDVGNDGVNDVQSVDLTGITPRPDNELEDITVDVAFADTTFVVFATGENVIDETLTVNGEVFTFVDDATAPVGPDQIRVNPTDRTQVVAQAVADAINVNGVTAGLATATQNSVAVRTASANVSGGTADSFQIFNQDDVIPVASRNVVYTSRDTTGTFEFTPSRHHFGGPMDVTVTVTDAGLDGIAGNGDDQSTTQSFTITILPVNDDPTVDPVAVTTVDEDDPETTITLTGITAGPLSPPVNGIPGNELEDVRISAALVDSTNIVFAIGANVVGETIQVGGETFTYVNSATVPTPTANQIAVSAVDAENDGAAATQDVAAATAAAINAHPNLGISSATFFENTINTTLPVVTSNAEAFVEVDESQITTAPMVEFFSRNAAQTGTIRFTPIGNAFGQVTINVITEDAGLDGIFEDDGTTPGYDESADNNSVTLQIQVQVSPVNDDPTMDQIAAQQTTEGAAEQSVLLEGITAGPVNELEDIRISPQLQNSTTVIVATGENVIGQTITVGGTLFEFVDASAGAATSTQIAVNTSDSTSAVATSAAAAINAELGAGSVIAYRNTINTLLPVVLPTPAPTTAVDTVLFALNSTEIVRDLAVDYNSRDNTATFRYTPFDDDNFGVVTVTITTEDAGVDGVFDDDPATGVDESADNLSIDRTFTITVDPINNVPTLDMITDAIIAEDPDADANGANDEQSITLTGIHPQAGITSTPGEELEDLQITAVLEDTTIVAFAAGANVIGETLTVSGTTFEFIDVAGAPAMGNQIAIATTATSQQVAAAAAAAINGVSVGVATAANNNVALAGVNDADVSGSDERDAFAIRNQDDLIANLAIDYVSRETTATLRFTPGDHQFGGPITVIVINLDAGVDGISENNPATGVDESADNESVEQRFTITLTPVNDTPLLDPIADQTVQEDSGAQAIGLTNIFAGPSRDVAPFVGEDSNELEDIALTHVLAATTTITFSIGDKVIGETVTVNGTVFTFVDAAVGATATTDIPVATTDATQTVAQMAAATINAELGANTVSWSENTISTTDPATTLTVSSPTVFAVRSASQLVQDLSIDYVSREETGTFNYTPQVDQFGQVIVTITATDAGVDGIFGNADDLSLDRTFTVTITPNNDSPTTDPIAAQTVIEDIDVDLNGNIDEQTVDITGVTPRPDNELEDIQITHELADTTTVVFAYGDNIIGEQLIVGGVTFNYVDAATTAPNSTQIAVNRQDSTQAIAAATAAVLNAHPTLGVGTATSSNNTITVAASTSPTGSNADRFAFMAASDIIENLAVDYVSRDTTGSFRYTPVADAFGLVRVTLTTLDAGVDGIFGTPDDLSVDTPFSITVTPDNDLPTMDAIADQTANEEGLQETVALEGITPRPDNELEDIAITHTLSDTISIAVARGGNMVGESITVNGVQFNYVDAGSTPSPTATQISVGVNDPTQSVAATTASVINASQGAGTATATNNTITVDAVTNPVVSSTDRFAVMPAASIVNNLQVVYTSRDNTGSFMYTPDAENFGQVTITINTLDAGVDGLFGTADDLSIDRVFNITVNPINDQPTLDAINDQTAAEDSGAQTVDLTGITPRPGNELEDIRVTHTLLNTQSVAFAAGVNLLPGEFITIGGTTFNFVAAGAAASATDIEVTGSDTTQTVATKAAAVINAQPGPDTVVASNNFITTSQSVAVSSTNRMAVQAAADIVEGLSVNYLSRDTTGTFNYTPSADAFGQATVTITAQDAGVDGIFDNADDEFVQQTFTITVTPDNDAPTMDAVAAQTTSEDSGEQSVDLTGITPRPDNELEDIAIDWSLNATTSVAIAAGANLVGESLTVGSQQFDFVDAATTPAPSPTQIAVSATDTTQSVAANAAAVIELFHGAGTIVATDNTVTVDSSFTVTASSTDTFAVLAAADIVQDIAVDYNSRDTTGTLRYTPTADAFGQVTVTLTTLDAGVDGIFGNGDDLQITRDVVITITPDNDAPTLGVIADQTANEDGGQQTVNLSGITPGADNELEDIRLTHSLHATTTVAIAYGTNVVGESLTIGGTTFQYVDAAVVVAPTATQIAVNAADSTQTVAATTATVVNNLLGVDSVVASDNTINTALTVTASSTDRFALMSSAAIIDGLRFNYSSRDTTGSLNYTPVADAFGLVTVTVTATDAGVDGIFGNADDLTATQTFNIRITPDNDAPAIGTIAAQTTAEDAPEQSVPVTDISVGPINELEDLQLSVAVDASNTLAIAVGANVIGDTITVGGTTFSYVDADVVVSPTASQIPVRATDATQIVAATTQTVVNASLGNGTVTATDNTVNSTLTLSGSSTANFALTTSDQIVSGLDVDYVSRDATATVRYTPVADAFGQVTITLTALDAGIDGIFGTGDDLSTPQSFTVTVTPSNDDPTLQAISNQTAEDSTEQSLALTGITTGRANELEDIRLSHQLLDTTTLAIGSNVIGETITIDGVDFTYVDAAVNTTPAGNEIAVNTGDSTQVLATKTAGVLNTRLGANSALASQNTITTALSVVPGTSAAFSTTTSADLISGLAIDYNSREATGSLRYTPIGNAFGVATVTVTAEDAGVDGIFGNFDDRSVSQTFNITVMPVNDQPTIDAVADRTVLEDSGQQTVSLSGITPGAGELEDVRISATIDDTTVLVIPSGGDAVDKNITINGEVFTYVTTPTAGGDPHEIVIIDIVTLVTVDSTVEVAEATANTLNAFFGAGSATANGNTVSTALNVGSVDAPFVAVPAAQIISQPVVNYTTGSTVGTINFTPQANAFGAVTVTLKLEDAGIDGVFDTADDAETLQKVNIFVQPVNDIPTLNGITDLLLPVSAGPQTVSLTGITNGPLNELDALRVTVTSSDTSFIPTPIVQYVSPQNLGTLSFTPQSGAAGSATITVTLEDAGVDGVFEDSVTPELEQADNLRIVRSFRVTTPPIVQSPIGVVTDNTPLLTWTAIPGTSSYQVELTNITDGVAVVLPDGGLTASNQLQITTPLDLANYSLRVRATDGFGVDGLWSQVRNFTVGTQAGIIAPVGNRLPDSTPTFSWTVVPGAEYYEVEVFDDVTGTLLFNATNLTARTVTVPDTDPLSLGRYRYNVIAVNEPADASNATVTSVASGVFTVSTPPEVLTPFVAIYDTTPTITWTSVVGAAMYDVEVVNVTTNSVEFLAEGVQGTSYTVPNVDELGVGEYRARVRAATAGNAVRSDWSTVHVFLVGTTPVLEGPTGGVGQAPFRKTVDARPTFQWEGSLDGETYQIWWNSVTEDTNLFIVDGIEETSYTPEQDLPIGRYRVWVRATTGTGERSPWSRSYDFEVVTPPTINRFATSTFNNQPTVTWNAQERVDSWQVWVNDVRNNDPVILYLEDGLTTNSFQFPTSVPDGRYRIWVRGFATNEVTGDVTTTQWSRVFQFDIGGRPMVTVPTDTTDTTPTVSWSVVDGAASYEIYLAESASPGSPIFRQAGLSATSFTFDELPIGDYRVWVRAKAPDGQLTPWSLSREGTLPITSTQQQLLTTPVLNQVTLANGVPTVTWGAVGAATRYDIYIAPLTDTPNPVVRVENVVSTSFTANAALAADDYRVWVRAINGSGDRSGWSTPLSFTVAALDGQRLPQEDEILLTSLGAFDSSWADEQVTVSQLPVNVVAADPDNPLKPQPIAVNRVKSAANATEVTEAVDVAEAIDSAVLDSGDQLMADWDDAIWAEESAAGQQIALEDQSDQPASAGWLASLAVLTPSVFRRKKDRKQS